MATPQESTTTFKGRQCTRSRARTQTSAQQTSQQQQAAQSAAAAASSSSSSSTTTTSSSEAQIVSSAAENPPPPPAPPAAVTSAATSAAAVLPSSDTSSISSLVNPVPSSAQSANSLDTSNPSGLTGASNPSNTAIPQNGNPSNPQSSSISSGGSAGIISSGQGGESSQEGGGGLTIGDSQEMNVGGIVGGSLGGFLGIAVISALLFFCLRRRKSNTFEKWQRKISEKRESDSPSFPDKVQGFFSGAKERGALLFAKVKGKKEPPQNHYQQSIRSSVSSVYSQPTASRSRSISEPPSKFRQQLQNLRGFGDRMPSLKKSRTLLRRDNHEKQDSMVNRFPAFVEDPLQRNSKQENPFADPEPSGASKTLAVVNPDDAYNTLSGLQDQQRGPLSRPPPSERGSTSRDPFASILDELDARDGSGTPEWLKDTSHKRTQSATTALRSNPPSSFYTTSVYTTADPFADPSNIPPVPNQPLPPNPPRRPSNAYNPMVSNTSRESNGSFFFGEPGPSRPTTRTFSMAPRPVGRQSDPFDLDRPEVLGFGDVGVRRDVRASITRQTSRSNRKSSTPGWGALNEFAFERGSAIPGPLKSGGLKKDGSTRR